MSTPEPPYTLLQYLSSPPASQESTGVSNAGLPELSTANPRLLRWARAFDEWLAQRQATTCAAYLRATKVAWRDFLAFNRLPPWEVAPAHVQAWIEASLSRRSVSTVQTHLTALSSFYDFVYEQGLDSQELRFNPVREVKRPGRTCPPKPPVYLSVAAVQALLAAIDRHTSLVAKRDYALILAHLLTAEQPGLIRNMRWSYLHIQDGKPWVLWPHGLGNRRKELPIPLWSAIHDYLLSSGRLPSITPTDYVFAPVDPLVRPPTGLAQDWSASRPLAGTNVHSFLKKYATWAGLPAERIDLLALRRTALLLQAEMAADPLALPAFLGFVELGRLWTHLDQPSPDMISVPPNASLVEPYPRRHFSPLPGDQRGLKHAFYTPSLSQPELQARLEAVSNSPMSLQREIAHLRLVMDLALDLFLQGDLQECLRLLDLYSLAASRLSKLLKADKELQGDDELSIIMQAIHETIQEKNLSL